MRPLIALTIANIKSFTRDRAAIFWTIAFPILFVVLFGSIFSGGSGSTFKIGWADQDGTPASTALRAAFDSTGLLKLTDGTETDLVAKMANGDLDGVIVVQPGLGAAFATDGTTTLGLRTDPSQQTQSATIRQVVSQVVNAANLQATGKSAVISVDDEALQTNNIGTAAYFVPSILAMALMQLGVFSAIPLVEQREKHILKRLSATPLNRATLVGSNIIMRLLLALMQTILIVAVGGVLFGVSIIGSLALVAGFVVLGSVTFISIGYVIASYAKTEESANALTSMVQFPLMFLSGIFFPIALMPDFLRPIATLMPLTYLGDALRQVMVGGAPFASLAIDALVLGGWLAVSFLISARYFRWQ